MELLLVLQKPDKNLVEFLVQAFLVFIFIVLPIVRGIRESIAKKRENERKRAGLAGAGEPDDEERERQAARERWEALLRGEQPAEAEAPSAPPPLPVPTPVQRERASDSLADPMLAADAPVLAPAPVESATEAADDPRSADPEHFIPDEEEVALAENARRLDEERRRREAAIRGRAGAGGTRDSVVPAARIALRPDAQPAAVVTRRAPSAVHEMLPAGADRLAALRRAVVLAEVLAEPAALRGPDAGPVGLRRLR